MVTALELHKNKDSNKKPRYHLRIPSITPSSFEIEVLYGVVYADAPTKSRTLQLATTTKLRSRPITTLIDVVEGRMRKHGQGARREPISWVGCQAEISYGTQPYDWKLDEFLFLSLGRSSLGSFLWSNPSSPTRHAALGLAHATPHDNASVMNY